MLAQLRMQIETDSPNFGYYQASNMQGIIMEHVEADYTEELHMSGLKPYSQYVVGGSHAVWVINALTEEAYQKIILPFLDETFKECIIKKKGMRVVIQNKELTTIPKKELLNYFYDEGYSRYINLEFLTPTAFKSGGKYIMMPDVRLIYQSLMNKYSAVSEDMDMYDEETLEQMVRCSEIVRYRLKSAPFPLEGVKIPAFKGELGIKITGSATMARYAALLAEFSVYSGVGIKTAIGMGAVQMKKWGKNDD